MTARQRPDRKPEADAEPRPPVGATSGLGVNETWISVFERNEQADEGDRLTDQQISEFMKQEFPGLDAKLFDRVEIARARYNRGGFHKKDKSGRVVRPKVRSKSHAAAAGPSGAARTPPPNVAGPGRRGPVTKHHKEYKAHKK